MPMDYFCFSWLTTIHSLLDSMSILCDILLTLYFVYYLWKIGFNISLRRRCCQYERRCSVAQWFTLWRYENLKLNKLQYCIHKHRDGPVPLTSKRITHYFPEEDNFSNNDRHEIEWFALLVHCFGSMIQVADETVMWEVNLVLLSERWYSMMSKFIHANPDNHLMSTFFSIPRSALRIPTFIIILAVW